jgi:hypothetical protein
MVVIAAKYVSKQDRIPTRTILLANELDRLQNRIEATRAFQDVDCPEKQRVVAARRVAIRGW